MENNIINDYTILGLSTEKLALKYKMGKIKIKQILLDNNVEIKTRGGQTKHHEISFKHDLTNKIVECKICCKQYNDIENKSGSLIEHMKTCHPDIIVPNKLFRSNYKKNNGEYWHFLYFNIIDKPDVETLKCPECDWETPDLTNKTGALTKHVINNHVSVESFVENNPDYEKYFKIILTNIEYNTETLLPNNYTICQICGEKLRVISNTHLKTHNITPFEYKLKYPNTKLSSIKSTEIFRKNSIIGNMNMTPTWTSSGEIEIINFIKSFGINCEKSKNRKLLMGKEIDILIDDIKIGIEYNGLYYHTERMGKNSVYHLNKTMSCNEIGYGLIHIFEDEWMIKKDIVKSKIKHILNVNDGIKIGGRNTTIKIIDNKEKIQFLNENHLQGNDKSNISYGAFYNTELVGVMTFNTKRNMTKTNINEYELSRFCIKQNYIISGLSSKILKQFILDYSPKSIISFADRRWTIKHDDNLYTKMGFKLINIVKPSYTYYNSKINKYKRCHKFGFGKNNLKKKYPEMDFTKTEKELTTEMGYDKIWDCGLFKYELIITE